MKSPTLKERGGGAQVGETEVNVIGPLDATPPAPHQPPAVVVLHRSAEVVLSDFHTQHGALGAHWSTDNTHTQRSIIKYIHPECRIYFTVSVSEDFILLLQ